MIVPMLIIRSHERGYTKIDWLESWHTFSFGEYYNPKAIQFENIRVVNEDIIQPQAGFGTHPHKDMEIVTIVLSGELEHKDSLGNGGILRPGKIQAMSAGTGIRHSEKNPSTTTPVHLLQIWVLTDKHNHTPRYQDATYRWIPNDWALIVSPHSADNGLWIHQNSFFYLGQFDPQNAVQCPGIKGLLMVITGKIKLNHVTLEKGDTVLLDNLSTVDILEISQLLFIST
jgi:redox-sensitive bicupin YhaK (pirin superfamily)